MNGLLKIVGLLSLVVLLSALSLYAQSHPAKHVPGPVVKVSSGGGHGSGFHAGDGYIVTAAHVVDGGDKFTVTLDDGSSVPAEVMWANKPYDVALLRIKRADFASSPLNCSVPPKGLAIEASGNPLSCRTVFG